ncbi:hypothetical protein BKN37_13000 [Mycobacterium talmoniae]|uniref:DUF3604 domain-containing protein n=2 Tax=Mycobacterium talmoniae TaxID=1858794 RepID=A0A1S1NDX7_9MYCO|nr:hypothetical protein [Mycobacterium talmoniae]OHV03831.1 hypothetical protein BKN37_13000 [Mycobacterium talmoniae]
MAGMSPTPPPVAAVSVRAQRHLDSHDCSTAAVRDRITAEFDAVPFLGTLTCSTDTAVAGAIEELVLRYTVGRSGIADSGWLKLCFRYYSDWDLQTVDPGARDFASARLISRTRLGAAPGDDAGTAPRLETRYDVKGGERPFQKSVLVHAVDGFLSPGDVIEIRLGDRRFGGPGTRVQTFVEDEFEIRLFVDALGTSRMAHAGGCRLAITPGPPQRLVVHGPRLTSGQQPDVALRAHLQDRWGNACRDIPATLRASAHGRSLATAHTPDHGWASATLVVPAQTARIDVAVESDAHLCESAVCYLDVNPDFPAPRAYFADLHVHSNDTVGTQSTDWNLAFGRDIGALDVLGYTANDFQITDAAWAEVVATCRRASQDGRFVCYPGVEWCGTAGAGGDHNVVFLGEDTTIARSLEWHQDMSSSVPVPETWPITRLYAAYDKDPESYLLIPHVGGRRATPDWHHPELERLIEVHSTWGTSSWFLEDALRRGLRLGASAASDEHRGRPGSGAPGANIFGGFGGVTGGLTPALTAGDVGRALRARRTWATTGARAVALLRSGDHWMGDDIVTGAAELSAEYALYGTSGWERLQVLDTSGAVWRRDFGAEVGLSDTLVRVRWGGARHRDRYRWATWVGSLRITGTTVEEIASWAATHPEQHFALDGAQTSWRTTTYGSDIGLVLRLGDLRRARFDLETRVLEDDRRAQLAVTGAELIDHGRREIAMGGLDLKLRLERIADPAALPVTVTGGLNLGLPIGHSATYLRAQQSDGHQVWTSPLFVHRLVGNN